MLHKKTNILLVALGFVLGAGSLVYAATTWQGTSSIQDGTIIQAQTIKDNFDYLYERSWDLLLNPNGVASHITNNLPVAAPAYCDEEGKNCFDPANEQARPGVLAHLRSSGLNILPSPEGLSEWPDYIVCGSNDENYTYMDFMFTRNGLIHYGTSADEGNSYSFKEDGSRNNAWRVPAYCSSQSDATVADVFSICRSGRCGFYAGGGPEVSDQASVPTPTPTPTPCYTQKCQCEGNGGTWNGGAGSEGGWCQTGGEGAGSGTGPDR